MSVVSSGRMSWSLLQEQCAHGVGSTVMIYHVYRSCSAKAACGQKELRKEGIHDFSSIQASDQAMNSSTDDQIGYIIEFVRTV